MRGRTCPSPVSVSSTPDPALSSPSEPNRPEGRRGASPSRLKPVAWTLVVLAVLGLVLWPKWRERHPKEEAGAGGAAAGRGGAPGGAATGRGGSGAAGGAGRGVTASFALVSQQTLEDSVTATGTLVAWEEVDVNAEVAGRLVALNLPEGAFVRQGQTLATLDTRVLAAQTDALDAQLDLARVQAGRLRQLFAIGGLSEQALDEATSRVRVLEAQVAQQRAEAARRRIVAPFSGRLGFRAVSVGAYVTPGQRLTTLRVTNPLRLEFAVPERYAGKVRSGATVEFSLPGDDLPVLGTVYALDPAIDASTRTFLVRARVGNPGDRLQPGAFAEVRLSVDRREGALVVPAVALVPGLDSAAVFVVKGGAARRMPVRVGLRTRDAVQVTGGVATGDTVLTSGFDEVRPGAPVRLVSPDGAPAGGASRPAGAARTGDRQPSNR